MENKEQRTEKYDLTYKKETGATIVGFLYLLIHWTYIFSIQNMGKPFYLIVTYVMIAIRVILIVWCVRIAKRQNRSAFGWGFFTFYLAGIALIIIGQLKKLKIEPTSQTEIPLSEEEILAKQNEFRNKYNIQNEAE